MLVKDREQQGHLSATQISAEVELRKRIIQEYFDSVRELIDRIKAFERHYELSSDEMIAEYEAGELPDTPEISEWLMSFERYRSIVASWPRLESSAPDQA